MVAWLLGLMNWQPLEQTLFRAWLPNVQATEVNKAAENQALLTGKDAGDEFNNDLIIINYYLCKAFCTNVRFCRQWNS